MRQLFLLTLFVFSVSLSAQKEAFKVMTYNLLYYKDPSAPCPQNIPNSVKDQNFKTVFKAVDPDILCVNEIAAFPDNSAARSVLSNVINTDGEQNFASAAFSNNGFSSITNMLFYDSTKFSLKSQSFIDQELGGQSLARVIDFYRLYYRDPGLALGADTVFFTVVVAHLKASTGTANKTKRENAAEAVMDYLTNSVSDENVILAGDMNLYTSSEGAFQKFTNYSVSAERFADPLQQSGSWNNNSQFASIHTQSTHSSQSGCFSSGGLDDRFDLILMSQAIKNATKKLNYKFNSYQTIGQDGNHFNQSVNSGTNGAVSQTVADALYNFSDHLPVVASFEVSLSGIGLAERREIKNGLLYANPFGKELVIRKENPSSGAMEIKIMNLLGKTVYQKPMAQGENILSIPTADWAAGVYLISYGNASQGMLTKKIVKSGHGL